MSVKSPGRRITCVVALENQSYNYAIYNHDDGKFLTVGKNSIDIVFTAQGVPRLFATMGDADSERTRILMRKPKDFEERNLEVVTAHAVFLSRSRYRNYMDCYEAINDESEVQTIVDWMKSTRNYVEVERMCGATSERTQRDIALLKLLEARMEVEPA